MSDRPEARFVKPVVAVVLALMDGTKSVSEIKEAVSYLYNKDEQEASEIVDLMLENFSEYLHVRSSRSSEKGRYDPSEFVYEAKPYGQGFYRCDLPLRMALVVTRRCPLVCIYCYADRIGPNEPETVLSIEKIREIMDEAREMQISDVYLGGGEPMLRRELPEIVRIALERGIQPHTSTKGGALSRSMVNELKESGLESIQISIDSLDPDVQDFLTQVKGSQAMAIRAFDLFQDAGFEVTSNAVITSYNIEGVPRLAKWLAKRDVRSINLSPYSRPLFRHREDLPPTKEQYQRLFRELKPVEEEMRDEGVHMEHAGSLKALLSGLTMEGVASCGGLSLGINILPDGRVTICEMMGTHEDFIYGDVSKQSIAEAWNSDKAKALVAGFKREAFKSSACHTCTGFDSCIGMGKLCYLRVAIAYGRMVQGVPDPLCPESPVKFTDLVR